MSFPRICLVALLATVAASTASQAQDDQEGRSFYRVEAIVFTHAGGQSDAWPVLEPARFANAIDPVQRSLAREHSEDSGSQGNSDLQAALSAVETIATLESGEQTLAEALIYPDPWLALETLSEPMAQARSRLERSGAYRIRTTLAWHQSVDGSGARSAVRVHDGHPLTGDWFRLSPTGVPRIGDRPATTATELVPVIQYRLDGTIRLRRRQFMHADITLDWRVPEIVGPSPWPVASDHARFEGHRLDQSRTVRPGRFEYFDSGWLGVVLRITPFEPEPTDSGDSGTAASEP